MDFKQELLALIDRHIAPSSPYRVYYLAQIALQQELIRLDLETDRFADDEIQSGLGEVAEGTPRFVDLDERELARKAAKFRNELIDDGATDTRSASKRRESESSWRGSGCRDHVPNVNNREKRPNPRIATLHCATV
jgi:hypothetical protein